MLYIHNVIVFTAQSRFLWCQFDFNWLMETGYRVNVVGIARASRSDITIQLRSSKCALCRQMLPAGEGREEVYSCLTGW